MLKKRYKLTGKDINFLFKKQNIVHGKYFSFFWFYQYPNRKYNQFAFQVPLKLSKKATTRNFIKRQLFEYIKKKQYEKKTFNGGYYKVFIVFNKKTIAFLKENVESEQKKLIKEQILDFFAFSFNNLNKFLGKR
ncbi:ribonuclease P protein component [Candidatus Absconditicoccus praedator]|uniref:ribonuclease P protein component n=1 Tax=Candidatus Absconditicoccus praedator TaxID=2735562 RepID=UPI001E56504D|nr:ribonuclease P protein component [Candidatus Absconditicoccus praedator]UFX83379.1 ribonuclease P protein component [Candidatus Absconditicoccus praedator]